MCDTIVLLGPKTKNNMTLFGKNSDREPDEIQNLKLFKRKESLISHFRECTYVCIPDRQKRAKIFLSQPFWMFGGEMGVNEYGVTIGNEAIFTRERVARMGLTGMDLLRLALEWSSSAREALEIIINLLERYGQGGNGGYRFQLYYMNSFLIADAREAFVLETVKKWWTWKKIDTAWNISNIISLQQDFDAYSPGLIKNALAKKYCRRHDDFNFQKCYTTPLLTHLIHSKKRQKRIRNLIKSKEQWDTRDIFNLLRDHGEYKKGSLSLNNKSGSCMHATDRLIHRTQTVNSMVVKLLTTKQYVYTTGASNPCLSGYFPISLETSDLPDAYLPGEAYYDPYVYWWKCEALHRKMINNFEMSLKLAKSLIDPYEENMVNNIEKRNISNPKKKINSYFERADTISHQLKENLGRMSSNKANWRLRRYWNHYNRINKIEARI